VEKGQLFELLKTVVAHKEEVTGPTKVAEVMRKYGVPEEAVGELLQLSLLDVLQQINVQELLALSLLSEGL
jgi:hypothetical protein